MKFKIFLFCIVNLSVAAQNKPGHKLDIHHTTEKIALDAQLHEAVWQAAPVAKDFFLNFPGDSALAQFQTEVRAAFDDENLYFGITCFDDNSNYIVQSLQRDFDPGANDNIGIFIGPYNDYTNGFYFTLSPLGAQLEGTISAGGAGPEYYSANWDNKWFSAVGIYKDRWAAEIAIPFKSFRYRGDVPEWNITFSRFDLKRNQVSSWIATPVQFMPSSFAYAGKLVWQNPPPAPAMNVSLIPYLAGSLNSDHEVDPPKGDQDLQVGLDAKIGITPSLNLDLTINPDFSQVEVDRQVINLTRFEFRFPERRQFFLENSDLLDQGGFPDSRSFFSRRIGLATDSTGNLRKVPILYGVRLSGKLSNTLRTNILNMHTPETLSLGLPNQNYTAAAVQAQLLERSSINIMLVNKESIGINDTDTSKYFHESIFKRNENVASEYYVNRYNRVLAIDLELRNKSNKWSASFFYAKSFDVFSNGKDQAGAGFLSHNTRRLDFFVGQQILQKNFNAEVGFTPALQVYPGLTTGFLEIGWKSYPKINTIARTRFFVAYDNSIIPTGKITDQIGKSGYTFFFVNSAKLSLEYVFTFQELTVPFKPINRSSYEPFQPGEKFKWQNFFIGYDSDKRKKFNYKIGSRAGGFYSGRNFNMAGEINYRYQPFGSVSVQFDYNDLNLTDKHGKESLFLIGARADVTFSTKLFFTTFLQFNELSDNINLNARFQWRFAPTSDFFIVYSDNYIPGTLETKSRALVFKLTYWFNL